MKTEQQALVEHVLEEFDFDKAKAYMEASHWVWRRRDSDVEEVPSYNRLRGRAKQLLEGVIKSAEESDGVAITWTGGLQASMLYGRLELAFVITSAEGYAND